MDIPPEVLEKVYQKSPNMLQISMNALDEKQRAQLYRFYAERMKDEGDVGRLDDFRGMMYTEMEASLLTWISKKKINTAKLKNEKGTHDFKYSIENHYKDAYDSVLEQWGAIDNWPVTFEWPEAGGIYASAIINKCFQKQSVVSYECEKRVDGFLAFLENKDVTVKKFGSDEYWVNGEGADWLVNDEKPDWEVSDILSFMKSGNALIDCNIERATVGYGAVGGTVEMKERFHHCEIGSSNNGAMFNVNADRSSCCKIGSGMKKGKIIVRSKSEDEQRTLSQRIVGWPKNCSISDYVFGRRMKGGIIAIKAEGSLKGCIVGHQMKGGSIYVKAKSFDKYTQQYIGTGGDGGCIHLEPTHDLSWLEKRRIKKPLKYQSHTNVWYGKELLHMGNDGGKCLCNVKEIERLLK